MRSTFMLLVVGVLFLPRMLDAADSPISPFVAKTLRPFLDTHCTGCHDADTKKGGLDFAKLSNEFSDPSTFNMWVKVHDKLRNGEMPPPKKAQPPKAQTEAVLKGLSQALIAADMVHKQAQGRAVFRRLNRTEYENTLRDLLDLPGLEVKELLPDDGLANGFNKSAAGLDISHVQLAKYMEAADHAFDEAIAVQKEKPEVYRERHYPAAQYALGIVLLNGDAIPLKDGKYDLDTYPVIRDLPPREESAQLRKKMHDYKGSVGVFRHEDCAFIPQFRSFAPVYAGKYRIRVSVWGFQWDKGEVMPATRMEAACFTVNNRLIGNFDAPSLKPTIHEFEIWMNTGEHIGFNAASLWPTRVSERKGRAAEYVGPGVAIDWLEVEGPLLDSWPSPSHKRLFGDLPLGPIPKAAGDVHPLKRTPIKQTRGGAWPRPGKIELAAVASAHPVADAERLLTDFLKRAFRRPVDPEEVRRYTSLVWDRMAEKYSFEEAMRLAYKAALCSPDFLFLKEAPGKLDDWALASRLSYFLWNSMPDDTLLALAAKKDLSKPKTLREQVERMLADPKAERFVVDFLDQWLDLREIDATTPDRKLYPEFSPYLRDSMAGETRAFFREMLRKNLTSANIVDSDFAIVNQRLAELYGIPGVEGANYRRVQLPAGSHRGGILTQGSVLKLTANGTVTSPVKRGAWVQRKIVGLPPEPPPPDIPAIEPDVRGTVSVRDMLAKHRDNASCAACHAKIDPPGFALESFDVIGGWRTRYRSLGEGDVPDKAQTGGRGVGYKLALPVDCSGETANGQAFAEVEQFKKILLEDPRQIARNLTQQLLVYSTGAPAGFADRATVEAILNRTAAGGFGVRSLIDEIVLSPAFLSK